MTTNEVPAVPGKEAEEFRRGIERIIADLYSDDHDDASAMVMDARNDLQKLLDRVDARDSVAHLGGLRIQLKGEVHSVGEGLSGRDGICFKTDEIPWKQSENRPGQEIWIPAEQSTVQEWGKRLYDRVTIIFEVEAK